MGSTTCEKSNKEIRFIDSHYKELFRIEDGGYVQMNSGKDAVLVPCTYIDEYHTRVGYSVYHICEFAEVMKRKGTTYQKEDDLSEEEAAWKVGADKHLILQTCDDGYDYTIYDEYFQEIDGGQLDMPELSMLEARNEILSSYDLADRKLYPVDYDYVVEAAEKVWMDTIR